MRRVVKVCCCRAQVLRVHGSRVIDEPSYIPRPDKCGKFLVRKENVNVGGGRAVLSYW